MNDQEFIMVHVIIAVSNIMAGVVCKLVNTDSPNRLVGYRTPWSMKSQETWDFANKYSGNMIVAASVISITIQVFSIFILEAETSIIVTVGVFTLALFVAIGLTEYQLRRRFDKEGKPKQTSADRY